jgi:Domain of unknown function (DUF6259)
MKQILLTGVLVYLMFIRSCIAGEVVLQDAKLLAAFDDSTGALVRMENKTTHWMVERRPQLGMSFRMFVPLPGRRYNFVEGRKQKAAMIQKISSTVLHIEWKNVVSENGGVLPIDFIATVTLRDGKLTFDSKVENNSSLTIETIDYPYFGDLNPPDRSAPMVARTMWYGNLGAEEIYPHFTNAKGYWGDFYPTKTFDSNRSLFCLIQSPHEGLYVEMQDPTQPYLLQFTFEQHPGVVSSITNLVPQTDEIDGKPVHLEFRTCHFVFTPPHSSATLAPVIICCYNGDWHGGVDLYKKWRATWFKPAAIPDWAKGVISWQEIQINSPEENYSFPYSDLVAFGKACAANGICAIQLVGWNKGGQDRGNPCLDTDPHLGAWRELHNAISAVQKMGVKIVLFGKFPWADETTSWYKNELYKYEASDPYTIPYENPGDSYLTPTQLAGINDRPFAVMDFLDPSYRNIAVHEFKKILALGADGFLYDEVPTHNPVYYNFASGHGYTPPGFLYNGDIPMAEQLHAAADSVKKDFLFAGEGPQDWLLQYYPLSYFRINASSTSVCRYIDPHAPLMVAVIGFDNREMLNDCLLDRYIISYEPYNFKGRLKDFPLTLAYGKKIDALRKRYKKYLWDADFRDTQGATVTGTNVEGFPDFVVRSEEGIAGGQGFAAGSYRYSVFKTTAGKRAVVVVNQEMEKEIALKIKLPNPGKLFVATPEQPDARPTSGTIQIPARSAAVVMEQ